MGTFLPSPRSLFAATAEKSINKTYICKNKTNIYINKTIICTNITFIYSFQRGVGKKGAGWWRLRSAKAMIFVNVIVIVNVSVIAVGGCYVVPLVFAYGDLVGCEMYCIKTVGDEDDGGVGMLLLDVEQQLAFGSVVER